MKARLITQDEFMERAEDNRLLIPAKFSNGYFVKGKIDSREVYATINEESYKKIPRVKK